MDYIEEMQEDFEYHMDYLRSTCNEYGFESKECKQTVQMYEDMYELQVRSAKLNRFGSVVWSFDIFLISLLFFGPWLLSKFLEYKSLKKELRENLKEH